MSVKDWTAQQCYDRALKLIEAEKFDKARKLLQLARIKDPSSGQIGQAMAIVDNLIAEASEAVANDGTMSAEQLSAAHEDVQAHIQAGELEDAAKMIQVVVSMHPEKRFRELQTQVNERKAALASGVDFEAQVRLREVLAKQDYSQAEVMVREQLRENRTNPILHWQLAVVLHTGMEKPEQAINAIREATRLAPDRKEILALAEDVERALGHEDEAESFKLRLEKAADGNSSDIELARMSAKEFAHKEDEVRHRPVPVASYDHRARERMRLILLAVAFVPLLLIAGVFYFQRQPEQLDTAPYSSVISVIRASPVHKDDLSIRTDELLLEVDLSSWKALADGLCSVNLDVDGNALAITRCLESREQILRDISYVAAENGYRLVVLRDEGGLMLGSSRTSKETGQVIVFLP